MESVMKSGLGAIFNRVTDVLTRERPKPITGTATLEVRVQDSVTVKEAVKIALCPPCLKDAA
jgi:hypothetical protein